MKLLVIGASGMIGSTVLRVLVDSPGLDVWGTLRDPTSLRFFTLSTASRLIVDVNVNCHDSLLSVLDSIRPNIVINCAGLTKHKFHCGDSLSAIPINSLMPHRLAALCKLVSARLVHISTDCVFSGETGGYTESDFTDARDLYGKTKVLGEVVYPHAITLRTSTIGHELQSRHGLLEWFLSQEHRCNGYSRAIFSGLPTVVFAQVIRDLVIPHGALSGIYHVASKPISKFDLLQLISKAYGKSIEIVDDTSLVIDRSLVADRFNEATGYIPPDWEELIQLMYSFK